MWKTKQFCKVHQSPESITKIEDTQPGRACSLTDPQWGQSFFYEGPHSRFHLFFQFSKLKIRECDSKNSFSSFFCMFLNPNIFSNLKYNCSNLLDIRNLQEQVKNHSVIKHCSNLSLFEWIALVIPKILQILGLQPRISKVFLDH